MRNTLPFLTLVLVFMSTLLYAQDPQIYVKGNTCSSPNDGACFYNLEPTEGSFSRDYAYIPVIEYGSSSTIPSSATKTYQWTVVGGTADNTTTQQTVVTWGNTKNYNNGSPTKTIRVKVTFTWTPSGTTSPTTRSISSILPIGTPAAQPIEVKYISTPSTINFAGSSLSNGNSLQFACGTTPQNLSVPAVTTDPFGSAVTYYFYYPANWSGPSSSSSPSVTVTPHSSSVGSITVEAKRNDSNLRTKITISVNRLLPSITSITPSSSILVCSSSDIITADALASNADKFIWTPVGGARVNGGTGPQTLSGQVNLSAVSNGSYVVKAFSTACNVASTNSKSLNIQYGPPSLGTEMSSHAYLCQSFPAQFYVINPAPNVLNYNWTVSGSGASLMSGQGTSLITVKSTQLSPVTITVRATNVCGQSFPVTKTVETRYCQNDWLVVTYPNPATENLTIEFKNVEDISLLPDQVKVYNENGLENDIFGAVDFINKKSFNNGNRLDLNVKNLPRGTNYFHLIKNDEVIDKVRVVLK